jgi:DNA-binding response OmpR family regulator
VIVLGRADPETKVRALARCDDYLTRPFVFEELVGKISHKAHERFRTVAGFLFETAASGRPESGLSGGEIPEIENAKSKLRERARGWATPPTRIRQSLKKRRAKRLPRPLERVCGGLRLRAEARTAWRPGAASSSACVRGRRQSRHRPVRLRWSCNGASRS